MLKPMLQGKLRRQKLLLLMLQGRLRRQKLVLVMLHGTPLLRLPW